MTDRVIGTSVSADPHDQERAADTRAWLVKVTYDLRAAETDLKALPPLLEDLLFHCQQAAEKAMKALLTWHDRPFRKTHDLVEIGTQRSEVDSTLEPLLRRAAPLTKFAWKYRYPGEAEEPSRGSISARPGNLSGRMFPAPHRNPPVIPIPRKQDPERCHPGGLFMELANKIELLANLKTPKSLGLTFRPSILIRATEEIQ